MQLSKFMRATLALITICLLAGTALAQTGATSKTGGGDAPTGGTATTGPINSRVQGQVTKKTDTVPQKPVLNYRVDRYTVVPKK